MEVVALQVFVSLVLVASSLILFGVSAKLRDHEHADRLALLPLLNEQANVTVNQAGEGHRGVASQDEEKNG